MKSMSGSFGKPRNRRWAYPFGVPQACRFCVGAMVRGVVVMAALLPSFASAQWVQMGATIEGQDAWIEFGTAVDLSSDGSTLAVGAPRYVGVGENSGQVRVFRWVNLFWVQMGEDIEGSAPHDYLGSSVALSSDGNRVAVGVPYAGEMDAGETHIYEWHQLTSQWILLDPIISGEAAIDQSGWSVSLSANGSRVAIGAPGNGVNGSYFGHARVFERVGTSWVQMGFDIDGLAPAEFAGWSVALSAGGSRVAVGSPGNSDSATGSGHVRVFRWSVVTQNWHQVGAPIAGDEGGDESGFSVALSSDGSRVAIGAPRNDGGGNLSGQVRVFEWTGSIWVQLGNNINGEAAMDQAGSTVALSLDGLRVAVGASENDSHGEQSGQVEVYRWSAPSQSWHQAGLDIEGLEVGGRTGYSVGLSSAGSRLAVGAPYSNDGGVNAGNVRVYSYGLFTDGFATGDTSAWSFVVP